MVVEQPHRVEAEGLSIGYQRPLPALLGAWHSEATTTFQAKPRHLAGLEARALWLKQVVTESELSSPTLCRGWVSRVGWTIWGFLPPLQG